MTALLLAETSSAHGSDLFPKADAAGPFRLALPRAHSPAAKLMPASDVKLLTFEPDGATSPFG